MRSLRNLLRRLRFLLHGDRFDRELDEEIRFHLEMKEREKLNAGLERDEAHRSSRREFGRRTAIAEESREAWGWSWLDNLTRDTRYGLRQLSRSWIFTTVAIASLTIGIGTVATVFTVANAVLLRPLPGREPERLVSIYTSDFSGPRYGTSSYADYLDFRDTAKSLTDLAAYQPAPIIITTGDAAQKVMGEAVTSNYFDLLGVPAYLGRTFLSSDEQRATGFEVVLSHRFWRDHLGADAAWVGNDVRIDGRLYSVVGIAEPGFEGFVRGLKADVWRTAGAVWDGENLAQRGNRRFFLMGRMHPSASLAEARAEFEVIARRQFQAYPDNWTDRADRPRVVTVLPEDESRILPMIRGPVLGFVGLLAAVGALVLITACTNVAGLLLARSEQRRREIGVRLSLGAARGRVIHQLVTESALLSVLGGIGGLGIAFWASRFLMAFHLPLPIEVGLDLELDYRVLVFSATLALVSGIIFGLTPALQASRTDLRQVLATGPANSPSTERTRLRGTFIVAQVAFSTVLLVGAGLLLRSLANADAIDPGFNPENVLLASVDLGAHGYDENQGRQFFDQLQARLEASPSVQAAAIARALPLGLNVSRAGISVEDHQPAPGEDTEIQFNVVGPSYFEALQVPLVLGRAFTAGDSSGSPKVVIVNEAFVRRFWPGQNAIGKRLARGTPTPDRVDYPLEVIGVARDGKYVTLGEAPAPYVYFPLQQQYGGAVSILLRTTREPTLVARDLRREIHALDGTLPVFDVKAMNEHVSMALLPVRAAATLVGVLGGVALLLTTLGIYGLVAYAVRQRTKEIGIRAAVGAQTGQLVRLMIGHGMRLTVLGLVIGIAAALGVSRFLEFLLYNVSPTDPVTFVGIACFLLAVVFLGCLLPARKAARIDPVIALRHE